MAQDLINNQPIIGQSPVESLPEEQPLVEGQPLVAPLTEGQPGMDESGMRLDIERKLDDVGSQNNALETKKFISKNKLKNFKIEMLRDIFAMLQKLGIDANDPNSIKNFLLSLEQQDPDLLTLFETIFDTLSPDNNSVIDELSTPPLEAISNQEAGEPNLMDKYNNLQGEILR